MSELVWLHIKIPATNDKRETAMEQFLLSVHRLLPKGSPISLEIVSRNRFLNFYICCQDEHKEIIESQLYASYPALEVSTTDDWIILDSKTLLTIDLNFRYGAIKPLKTHHHLEDNFLKNISSLTSQIDPSEVFFIQINLQTVGSHSWERGINGVWFDLFGKKYSADQKQTPSGYKFANKLFKGKVRLGLITGTSNPDSKLSTFANFFKQLDSPSNKLTFSKPSIVEPSSQKMNLIKSRAVGSNNLWMPAEIATIYHFPYKLSQMSNVAQTTSKKAPPPDILPTENNTKKEDLSLIGETNFRDERIQFGIKRIDRPRHLYIVGKTGSGKSRLLQLLLMSDIESGQGCCLIDPHGDLADELLTYVPKERIKDVVYINPTDRDFPIGFNPLEPVEDYETRQHLSRFFISIFKKLFAESWNPRMEHLIRYITLALLETPDSNILGISRILSDATFRQRVIKQIQDPVVKNFWTTDFSASNEQFINAAAVPIMNKVGQFISNPIIRNMVGQRENMLDFDLFMNQGKIVIINLSKGKLGEDNAALLGSMFITKIQQAALARAKIKEEDRRDFYFYVDEFQNFATDAFSSILSEARKYRLDLTIAHQYIAQLPEDVKATTFGNVGTIIAFSMGGDDASYLAKEFAPTFSQDDMINLNIREMYIKMSIDGRLSPPFSARTINVIKSKFNYSEEIINKSRLTYGKNRIAVENEIKRWSDSTEAIDNVIDNNDFPEPVI